MSQQNSYRKRNYTIVCGSVYVTKFDAKAGYWSVQLEEDCQAVTTFRTSLGRYCFCILPFGLCVSQDIFQRKINYIISQCEGCVGISDDIIIHGSTEEEHDRRVIDFLNVARKEGLKLNPEKCVFKSKKVTFFGRLYTDHGVFPDPEKTIGIDKMPQPSCKQELQTFWGMVTYLSNHLPNLSKETKELRELLKHDIPFEWTDTHESAFTAIKSLVSKNIGLQYYDPSKPVRVEVDASSKELGAALLQNCGPICFASRALTDTESRYNNIERECAAVVYGVQRFHHYLFGRQFRVLTDHKPLEVILHKPLHSAPPRLQRMMLKIQGYDYDIQYRPGVKMTLADSLSRLPNLNKAPINVDLMTGLSADLSVDVDNPNIDMMNFSSEKEAKIREDTKTDSAFSLLLEIIYNSWPEDIKSLPQDLRQFWSYHEELAVENGIIFNGKQVLLPSPSRNAILT